VVVKDGEMSLNRRAGWVERGWARFKKGRRNTEWQDTDKMAIGLASGQMSEFSCEFRCHRGVAVQPRPSLEPRPRHQRTQ